MKCLHVIIISQRGTNENAMEKGEPVQVKRPFPWLKADLACCLPHHPLHPRLGFSPLMPFLLTLLKAYLTPHLSLIFL